MSEPVAMVLIAVITGIFGLITLYYQRRQDKLICKIEDQASFMEREKAVKHKLLQAEQRREEIIQRAIIMILEASTLLLSHSKETVSVADTVVSKSEDIKSSYTKYTKEVCELSKEYEIIFKLTADFQREMAKMQKIKK